MFNLFLFTIHFEANHNWNFKILKKKTLIDLSFLLKQRFKDYDCESIMFLIK